MGKLRLMTALVVAAGLVVAAASAATSSGPLPTVVADYGLPGTEGLGVRPGEIVQDQTTFLAGKRSGKTRAEWKFGRITWFAWNGTEAVGEANDWVGECHEPCSLASDLPTAFPATITLYQPKKVHGQLIFTRMTVVHTKQQPPYTSRVETLTASYSGGAYWWG